MKFLGIGTLELLLIFIVIVLVLGPVEITSTARKIGEFIRKTKKSELWQTIRSSKDTLSKFSEELISDSGIEEVKNELADLNALRDKNRQFIEENLTASVGGTSSEETEPTEKLISKV